MLFCPWNMFIIIIIIIIIIITLLKNLTQR
jgi:hypothetical protein